MSPIQINQVFNVHPVGQGLFFSGIIRLNASQFTFVFDCGSLSSNSPIEQEIIDLKNSVSNGIIDLLIISHFDKDHVSHIKKLKDEFAIKRVIAPFISFKERVSVFLSNIDSAIVSSADIESYYSLLFETKSFFSNNINGAKNQPTEIILVEKSLEESYTPPNEDRVIERTIENLDLAWDSEPENVDETYSEYGDYKVNSDNQAYIGSFSNYLRLSGIEVVSLLFYRPDFSERPDIFFDEVWKQFSIKQNLDLNTAKFSEQDKSNKLLEAIITTKTVIPESGREDGNVYLKEIVKLAKAELKLNSGNVTQFNNRTALSLLIRTSDVLTKKYRIYTSHSLFRTNSFKIQSFINEQISIDCRNHFYGFPFGFFEIGKWKENFAIMLTSDSYLKEISEVDDFINYYKFYLHAIGYFQVPHHGSKYNSSINIYNRLYSNPDLFINYGIRKNGKHPSPETLNAIVASGLSSRLRPVTQYSGIKIVRQIEIID